MDHVGTPDLVSIRTGTQTNQPHSCLAKADFVLIFGWQFCICAIYIAWLGLLQNSFHVRVRQLCDYHCLEGASLILLSSSVYQGREVGWSVVVICIIIICIICIILILISKEGGRWSWSAHRGFSSNKSLPKQSFSWLEIEIKFKVIRLEI